MYSTLFRRITLILCIKPVPDHVTRSTVVCSNPNAEIETCTYIVSLMARLGSSGASSNNVEGNRHTSVIYFLNSEDGVNSGQIRVYTGLTNYNKKKIIIKKYGDKVGYSWLRHDRQ